MVNFFVLSPLIFVETYRSLFIWIYDYSYHEISMKETIL